MNDRLTTIWTPTYNKPEYLRDAARSVLAQRRPLWRWWIILDGAIPETVAVANELQASDPRITVFHEVCSEEDRRRAYRPAVLHNKYVDMIHTDYFAILADDDFLDPIFVEILAGHIEVTGHAIAYGALDAYAGSLETGWRHSHTCPGHIPFGPHCNMRPDCVIDGGQILQRIGSWRELGWRMPTDWSDAHHIDGVYLNALAARWQFQPVVQKVVDHRMTPKSTWRQG